MDPKRSYDPQMARVLLVLVLLEVVVAEATLIITAAKSPETHSSVRLLATLFVTTAPAVIGISHYRQVGRFKSAFGVEASSDSAARLQIQFLGMAAATYAAMIVIMDFFVAVGLRAK